MSYYYFGWKSLAYKSFKLVWKWQQVPQVFNYYGQWGANSKVQTNNIKWKLIILHQKVTRKKG